MQATYEISAAFTVVNIYVVYKIASICKELTLMEILVDCGQFHVMIFVYKQK